MEVKLEIRDDELAPKDNKTHYHATRDDGKTFSVVDIGEMMRPIHRKFPYDGMFQGWESIAMDDAGELISDSMMRADSWEELSTKIANY